MKHLRTVSLGLIIATWGIFHTINLYSSWLLRSRDYAFVHRLYLHTQDVAMISGYPVIFAFGYVVFWIGFGLMIATLLQEGIDKAWLRRKTKKAQDLEKPLS